VCIDARLDDGAAGGVQQTIIGLASGLSQLDAGGDEFHFLVHEDSADWLRPHLGRACRLLPIRRGPAGWKGLVGRVLPRVLTDAFARSSARALLPMSVPPAPAAVERGRFDVVHLALQYGFRTSQPSIYVPHDLQHLQFPEYFTDAERAWRHALYPALCAQAECVVALSEWGKRDLVERLGVDAGKIRVISWAPAIDAYPVASDHEVAELRRRRSLPEAFVFYPGQTFRHKNHLRLIEALALLRDRDGLDVHAVFCGHRNDHHRELERAIRALHLESRVRFLGFVAPEEVAALYRGCRLVAYPSEFEGFGLPVLEAFRAGAPVACSNATCLPEVTGDAALLFDPRRVDEIASAVRALWTDIELRRTYAARGEARARRRCWTDVARTYRALYRRIAGWPLSDEDRCAVFDAT
jgi:glycosyltransferase involved in cell wall biosynthesis